MNYINKFFQYVIVIILFIHLGVIGTPFTISEADEVVESSQAIENHHTYWKHSIVRTYWNISYHRCYSNTNLLVITYTEDSTTSSESETITNDQWMLEEWVPSTIITYTEESLWTETNTNIIMDRSTTDTWSLDEIETNSFWRTQHWGYHNR